jgi:DNA (cytosine-5)-methyltransferase 1
VNVLSLFSGIGGLELGLERAGMTVAGQVELDPYCREVLSRHWPEVPRHDDVRTAAEWWQSQQRPCVDLVAGGFPCQPFSKLGSRRGIDDERWGWPWMANVVRVVRPRYVLVENVSALVRDRDAFSWVLGDLHQLGFDAQWTVVSACSVGAPHTRDRVFLLAYPACGDGQQPLHLSTAVQGGRASAGAARGDARAERWIPEPDLGRVAHGLSKRVVAPGLRALGNAVVPHVAEVVGRLIVTADTNWRHAA